MKRCVLRAVLKDERVLALRMSLGRALQRAGAAAAKAPSPQDRRLVLMGCRRLANGGPETTGRGMAVEKVREGGGRQVVEGFEGDG